MDVDPAFWPGSVHTTIKESWWDGFVGARAFFDVAEKWTVILRGDIGGLGLSSDFTAFGMAGFMYHFTDAMSLDIAMGGSTNTILHLLAVQHILFFEHLV